jgi:hypothetical protein
MELLFHVICKYCYEIQVFMCFSHVWYVDTCMNCVVYCVELFMP